MNQGVGRGQVQADAAGFQADQEIGTSLTELQLQALRHIEGFGWDLCFVRRHNVAEPIAVVSDPTGKTIGVLEADGRVNLEHKLRIRP